MSMEDKVTTLTAIQATLREHIKDDDSMLLLDLHDSYREDIHTDWDVEGERLQDV